MKEYLERNLWDLVLVFIFVVLFLGKVFGRVDLSWWWVFAPLWGPFALVLAILLFCGALFLVGMVGLFVYYFVESLWKQHKRDELWKDRVRKANAK